MTGKGMAPADKMLSPELRHVEIRQDVFDEFADDRLAAAVLAFLRSRRFQTRG